MRRFLFLLFSFPLLLLMSCNSIEVEQKHVLVSGSRAFAPMMRAIADRFQAKHPGVRVDISTTPVDRLVSETREGLVDVALLGRMVRNGDGLRGVEFARDGLAFIVHPSNPVPALDERQLVGLLTRAYADWSDVGGTNGRVVVDGVADGHSLRQSLLRRFQLEPANVPVEMPLYRDEQVVEAVANDPRALGYVSLATALEHQQSVRLLSLEGVSPTLENVRNGRYSYVRSLVVATRVQPNELAAAFLEFAQCPEVHDLIERYGFASTTQP